MLTLPEDIKKNRILHLVDYHPSRSNFKAALILYLLGIDLVLILLNTSHFLQAFEVKGFIDYKQTARELMNTMIKSISAHYNSATFANIQAGFQSSGIATVDRNVSPSSEYAVDSTNYDAVRLLKYFWPNNGGKLKELFYNENNREVTENNFIKNLNEILKNIKSSLIHDKFA